MALMDGHECTEILFSQLERTNRIDPEFYSKKNLNITKILSTKNCVLIGKHFNVSDGNHMSISEHFCDSGVPYYRGQDIYNLFIEDSSPQFIDIKTFNKPLMKRSHLRKNDILISIVGAIVGNSSIVSDNIDSTCSCKLAIIRPQNDDIFSETLLLFIKSKYGQNQIQKFKRGTAQTGLILEDFDQLLIPLFDRSFQIELKNCFAVIKNLSKEANNKYKEAEEILNSRIGINLETTHIDNISIKSFSESFNVSGRLDAEYYHPKYEVILNAFSDLEITSIPSEFDIFKNTASGYSEDGTIGVIKTKQLSNIGINIAGIESKITKKSLVANKLIQLQYNDVVFASMGVGSLGKVSIFNVEDDSSTYVTDSTLKIFRAKANSKVIPEVLTVYLQSTIGQELIYKYVVGSTGIINIYDSDIAAIPIPVLDNTLQSQIAQNVHHAFILRKKAKELLDIAIKCVEIAIDQNETKAINWLKSKINSFSDEV